MQMCPAFEPLGPYVGNVVAYADCQALAFGEAGYRALGSGSPFGMALTGLLTIYVALIGYRLLMGGDITIRNTMSVALRLGIVLALATQWSAYRLLVFDVATKVPQELATAALGPAGLDSQGFSSLTSRIDGVRAALEDVGKAQTAGQPATGTGQGQAPPGQPASGSAAQTSAQAAQATAAALVSRDQTSVAAAVGTLAVTALAGLLSVRVPMALLLALGPVFIAFLLFDGTRGLFNSWVRVLAGTVLGALAVPAVLALELAIIEPQVRALRDLILAREPLGTLPLELLATTAVFALVMLAALAAAVRAAMGFRLPQGWWRDARLPEPQRAVQSQSALEWNAIRGGESRENRSRAQLVAEAAMTRDWRDSRLRDSAPGVRAIAPNESPLAAARDWDGLPATLPLGQSGRRSSRRTSTGALRRDELI